MCSHTHTKRVMLFPKSGLEGEPVPGPPQERRIESTTKSIARRTRNTRDGKSDKGSVMDLVMLVFTSHLGTSMLQQLVIGYIP